MTLALSKIQSCLIQSAEGRSTDRNQRQSRLSFSHLFQYVQSKMSFSQSFISSLTYPIVIVIVQYNLESTCKYYIFIIMSNPIFILAFIAFSLAHPFTDKQILQAAINGIYEQNRLPHPNTIVKCFNDIIARDWAIILEQSLARAAQGEPIDYYHLIKIIKLVAVNMPLPVYLCLFDNAQVNILGQKYGLYTLPDRQALFYKFIDEVALNYEETNKQVVALNAHFKNKEYFRVGFEIAEYLHNTIKKSYKSERKTLQDLMSGLFKAYRLFGPITIVRCFDDATARKILQFIRETIKQLALTTKDKEIQFTEQLNNIHSFYTKLPLQLTRCLYENIQLQIFIEKFDPDNRDGLTLEAEMLTYFTKNKSRALRFFKELRLLWRLCEYRKVGYKLGDEQRTVFEGYNMQNDQ